MGATPFSASARASCGAASQGGKLARRNQPVEQRPVLRRLLERNGDFFGDVGPDITRAFTQLSKRLFAGGQTGGNGGVSAGRAEEPGVFFSPMSERYPERCCDQSSGSTWAGGRLVAPSVAPWILDCRRSDSCWVGRCDARQRRGRGASSLAFILDNPRWALILR